MKLFGRTPRIDPAEAADRLAARNVVIVDVRQATEWQTGHIKGAIHIPLAQLSSQLHQLPQGKTIVTVCRSGHRSAGAARTLTRHGHDVLNLHGGINAWARAGLPLTTRNARNK